MATAALAFAQLANDCEKDGLTSKNAEKIGAEIAKAFSVEPDEVAILRVQDGSSLAFAYPSKLSNVGTIPISTSTSGSSVAARTASNKRAEVVNNFAQTKHASVFEAMVPTHAKSPDKVDKHAYIIQKMMSAPVVGPAGVLGVIQVCRKGTTAPSAGADFSPLDLQKLVTIATTLVKCFK